MPRDTPTVPSLAGLSALAGRFEREMHDLFGIVTLGHPAPRRLAFDLLRVMRTEYRIDRFQDTYFVIDGFDRLFAATSPDFTPLYRRLEVLPDIAPDGTAPGDSIVPRELAA